MGTYRERSPEGHLGAATGSLVRRAVGARNLAGAEVGASPRLRLRVKVDRRTQGRLSGLIR